MKTFLLCLFIFTFGLIFMAGVSSYASKVWSYNQLARSREAMTIAAYKAYGEGRIKDAASLASGANMIAGIPDQQWNLTEPFFASFFRFFGAFKGLHVEKSYNAYIAAYLYHISGDEDQAKVYYDLASADGTSREKANKSAKIFLDSMSSQKK